MKLIGMKVSARFIAFAILGIMAIIIPQHVADRRWESVREHPTTRAVNYSSFHYPALVTYNTNDQTVQRIVMLTSAWHLPLGKGISFLPEKLPKAGVIISTTPGFAKGLLSFPGEYTYLGKQNGRYRFVTMALWNEGRNATFSSYTATESSISVEGIAEYSVIWERVRLHAISFLIFISLLAMTYIIPQLWKSRREK